MSHKKPGEHLKELINRRYSKDFISKQELNKLLSDFDQKYYTDKQTSVEPSDKSSLQSSDAIEFLAQSALELVEIKSLDELYEYTANTLYQLLNKKAIITVVDYHMEKNYWQTKQIRGVENFNKISSLLGFDLYSMTGQTETQYLNQLERGKLTELDFDLPGLTEGKISAFANNQIKRILSIDKIYCIVFKKHANMFGNVSIFPKKGLTTLNGPLIEAFIGQVSNFADILNHKQMLEEKEKKLKQALEKAEESDRLKSVFLTNISHEVRTPMNGIIGFTEMLKNNNPTEEEYYDYLHIIEQSSNRLLKLIDNLVDISLIQAKEVQLKTREFNLNKKLRDLYSRYNASIDKELITLDLQLAWKDSVSCIATDPVLFEKIFIHLLDNAVKYTSKGTITFGYTLKDNKPEFFVSDTGIGIHKETQDKIFVYFRQEYSGLNRQYEGAGLGLAICSGYIKMLDGEIWVKSTPQNGSTFYFTIEYKTCRT
ncbi:MAG: sensor histidine kinase [Bacteroidales bacterium]